MTGSKEVQQHNFPEQFTVSFKEHYDPALELVFVASYVNGKQYGDLVDDHAHEEDFYRYHDIFHYCYSVFLNWSPCTRALLDCRRTNDFKINIIEDGAKARYMEEAISLIIFHEAKEKNFFSGRKKVSKKTVDLVRNITSCLEVRSRPYNDWVLAIHTGYKLFRELIKHRGGVIHFDRVQQTALYTPS